MHMTMTKKWILVPTLSLVLLAISLPLSAATAAADSTMKFNYRGTDITKVIEDYANASGQKFIISPDVKGQITIINPKPIAVDEAFNQLSTALATNGLGISDQNGVMLIQHARSIQRNFIEVGTTLPPMRPERMFTWVINLKNASADDVNKQLRILTSRDGELVPYTRTNQLLITDWVSNLYRISKIVQEIDSRVGKAKK
ncbi:MAG: secretin N-terminal domain-containing protein [Bdellovibrionales bacterium]